MTGTRRPIATRNTGWAQRIAQNLAQRAITPNQISQGSIAFAGLAFIAFWLSGFSGPVIDACLFGMAALACQGRLLCNLFDGMVAVEGGKSEPDGPFWNEAPDRAADFLILTGMGLASGQTLAGVTAAAFAIATAYVRELGRAEGVGSDFSGPLAKPQRMAVATVGAVCVALESLIFATAYALSIALWIILIGTGLTVFVRCKNLIHALQNKTEPRD